MWERHKATKPLPCLVLCSLFAAIVSQSLIEVQSQHCQRPEFNGGEGKIINSAFFSLVFSFIPYSSSPSSSLLSRLSFQLLCHSFLLPLTVTFSPLVFLIFSHSLFLFLSHLLSSVFSIPYILLYLYLM